MTSFERNDDRVVLATDNGRQGFDHVVFACHSDQALKIIGDQATSEEREILSCFPYEKNVALLHTQDDVLPRNRRAWACWNYLREVGQNSNSNSTSKGNDSLAKATVTYNMNILQSLNCQKTYCVTLNDTGRIRDENVLGEFVYHHPTFDLNRSRMQQRQSEIIGVNRTSFCGAYWGNGFHEDGVNSALAVVTKLTADSRAGQPVTGTTETTVL